MDFLRKCFRLVGNGQSLTTADFVSACDEISDFIFQFSPVLLMPMVGYMICFFWNTYDVLPWPLWKAMLDDYLMGVVVISLLSTIYYYLDEIYEFSLFEKRYLDKDLNTLEVDIPLEEWREKEYYDFVESKKEVSCSYGQICHVPETRKAISPKKRR